MPVDPSDQMHPSESSSLRRRSALVMKTCILVLMVLALIVLVYFWQEQFGEHRITDVKLGIPTGIIKLCFINVEGKKAPPIDANLKLKITDISVQLVDSERDPHFRIKFTLWDGKERELKHSLLSGSLPPNTTPAAFVKAQLAQTSQDGAIELQINYLDTSLRGDGNQSGINSGVRKVPVTIVKE